jgi:hypothetical protein
MIVLLFEESHFIEFLLLYFPEISLEVGDVFKDLFYQIVNLLYRLVLQSCALTPQNLCFFLIVIDSSCEILHIVLKITFQ